MKKELRRFFGRMIEYSDRANNLNIVHILHKGLIIFNKTQVKLINLLALPIYTVYDLTSLGLFRH